MSKKVSILLLALLAVVCQSCLRSSEDYTPTIACSVFKVGDSTLVMGYDTDADMYMVDTIAVGDTVAYAIAFATYSNNLVSVSAQWDEKSLEHKAGINDTIKQVLDLDKSDPDKCQLSFKAGYNGVAFPVRVVALREGATILTYEVVSDSKFHSATMKFRFYVD